MAGGAGSSGVQVRRWADAAVFRAHAEPWLRAREAEHTVLLGVLDQLERDPSVFQTPVYLATVEEAGEIVGCSLRTPPYKLALTRMPLAAAEALAADLDSFYAHLPTAGGPEEVALRFGEAWARRRRVTARPGARHRLYRADEVLPAARRPAGRSRVATLADLPAVRAFHSAFEVEIGGPRAQEALVAARVERGWLWLWEDGGEPVALGGWPARGERWVRVGYIYTPPALRGRGYASALTSDLTRMALSEGRYAVLYADVANPTSNSIYQRIGYRSLGDVVDVDFGGRATT